MVFTEDGTGLGRKMPRFGKMTTTTMTTKITMMIRTVACATP